MQAGLCVLWALLMAAMIVRIYCEGTAVQAQGNPEVWVFTREKVMEAFAACAPVLAAAVAVTIICAVTGVRDEGQDRPVADPGLVRIYKAERAAAGKMGRDDSAESSGRGSASGRKRMIFRGRVLLFVIAAVLIIAGIFNGSMEDTLIKAINICTECIGLG